MQPRLLLALLFAVSASTSPAGTGSLCENTQVTAIGWNTEYEKEVCSVARDTLRWICNVGLKLSERVVIRPLDAQYRRPDPHVLGSFDAETREIQILGFDDARAATAQDKVAFGVPMSKDLWRSYIAHEIAHAVVDPYIGSNASHLRAAEYIAGVVQLTIVQQPTRDAILSNYQNIAPWSSASEISHLYYFMAPAAFAVKSYRHFIGLPQDEQRGFVSNLLREPGSD